MDYVNSLPQTRDGKFSVLKQGGDTRSSEPDLVLGELQLDEIKVATNSYGRSNYTFLLRTLESQAIDSISAFNLVLKDTRTGLHSYIVEYRTASSGIGLTSSIGSSSYSGKIIYYNIDGYHAVSIDVTNGTVVNSFARNPCPGGGDVVNPGGGGSTGDGGPGGPGGPGGGSGGTDGGEDGGGDSGGTCELIPFPCGCAAHWPWECSDCQSSPPGWVESCDDDKVMEDGILKLDFLKNTRRCPGDNTDCNIDCLNEINYDDCSCADEPSDDPDQDENTDVVIDISNLLILFDDESWEDYECQKSIVRNVYNVSSPITDLFQEIFGENPNTAVTFTADIDYSNFGSTSPNAIGGYGIKFGNPFFYSTDLMMATVTAHEVFHANLYHLYNIRNNDADSSNDITIEGLMTGEEPSYAQLINTWAILETSSMDAQHDYIADYKNEIAQSVYDWAVVPSPFGGGQDPNDPTLLPYLKQLAWVGLEDTSAWENLTDDPNNQALVAEIETTIQQETDPYQTDNEKGNPCE